MARQASSALTLAEFAKVKGFTVDELTRFGVRDGFDRIEVPYYDERNAVYARMRTRTGERGFAWTPGNEELIPYGLWVPVPAERGFIVVAEGESDCWALWLAGIPALGVPGATATSVLHAAQFAAVERVAVIQEPGEAGARFPFRVAQRLKDTGYTGEVFAISLGQFKDARDAFVANRETFALRLADAWRARKPVQAIPAASANAWPKFYSFGELLAKPRVAPDWLVDGLIPTGGTVLLVSKPKVGKSVLARTIAYHVATGTEFFDRAVRQGPVVWLGLEEHEEYVRDEFEALGATGETPLYLCFERAPEDALAWLVDAVKGLRPALIVVDTWIHLTRCKDVNDYAAVTTANAPLVALAHEHGAAMLWLHHANKAQVREDSVLGSNALFAASDVLIGISRDSQGARTLWTRQRQGEELDDELLVRDPQTGRVHLDGSRFAETVKLAGARLVRVLADCGPLVRAELARRIETRAQVFRAALRQRIGVGDVAIARGTGKARDPYIYAVTDSGLASSAMSAKSDKSGSSATSQTRDAASQNVRELYPRCARCDTLLNPRMKHPDGLCTRCEHETE